MRVTFRNQLNACIATKDESVVYKDLLYTAFSDQSELLVESSFYRVKGLLVRLPVDNPTGIEVTVEWIRRQDSTGEDYC